MENWLTEIIIQLEKFSNSNGLEHIHDATLLFTHHLLPHHHHNAIQHVHLNPRYYFL